MTQTVYMDDAFVGASSSQKRIAWIENGQILSMLLVVIHHSLPHGYDGPAWLHTLFEVLQHPALACFFFISGFLAVRFKSSGWRAYMKKRALRLLAPYFGINLLMLLPKLVMARLLGRNASFTVSRLARSFLYPHSHGISPHLWFLPAIFICAAALPIVDHFVSRSAVKRRCFIGVLLVISALPLRFSSFLCLNELKQYFFWYVIGYSAALHRDRRFMKGIASIYPCVLCLSALIASVLLPYRSSAAFVYSALGLYPLLCLSFRLSVPNPLTRLFSGRTHTIYILSMCVQNFTEAVCILLSWDWTVTSVLMLVAGLSFPCLVFALNAKRRFPRPIRLLIGL